VDGFGLARPGGGGRLSGFELAAFTSVGRDSVCAVGSGIFVTGGGTVEGKDGMCSSGSGATQPSSILSAGGGEGAGGVSEGGSSSKTCGSMVVGSSRAVTGAAIGDSLGTEDARVWFGKDSDGSCTGFGNGLV
jgi:hypothetical protein